MPACAGGSANALDTSDSSRNSSTSGKKGGAGSVDAAVALTVRPSLLRTWLQSPCWISEGRACQRHHSASISCSSLSGDHGLGSLLNRGSLT